MTIEVAMQPMGSSRPPLIREPSIVSLATTESNSESETRLGASCSRRDSDANLSVSSNDTISSDYSLFGDNRDSGRAYEFCASVLWPSFLALLLLCTGLSAVKFATTEKQIELVPIVGEFRSTNGNSTTLSEESIRAGIVDSQLNPTNSRCIDFELRHIDALTEMPNQKMMLIANGQYWVLEKDDIPSKRTARPAALLLRDPAKEGRDIEVHNHQIVVNIDLIRENHRLDNLTVDAAFHLMVKPVNGTCVPTSELILYSFQPNNQSAITTINLATRNQFTTKLNEHELVRAAKSVNWATKVNALAYYDNKAVIFQDDHFTSIECSNGAWQEILNKKIADTFVRVTNDSFPLDAVYIKYPENSTYEYTTTALMFKGHEFYECLIQGNDPCQGPYNLMSEFFNLNIFCPIDNEKAYGLENYKIRIALVMVLAILATMALVALVFYFCRYPVNITYFVNGKLSGSSRGGRDNLSYEALKLQCDSNNGVECKAITNGNNV